MVVVAVVALVAVVLFVAGLVAPKRSRKLQKSIDRALGSGAGTAVEAPGRLGEWVAKPFRRSQKATDKSTTAGRKTRFKLPF